MLTIASFLAAMTIAGAFWVGVLAARRLRDWGEGRRALEEGHPTLALAASSVVDDPAARRVRDRVASQLAAGVVGAGPRALSAPRAMEEVTLETVREGDVISVESGVRESEGDYIVEGIVRLRQGSSQGAVLVMSDGDREAWLVGMADEERWLVVAPVSGHGLRGEPPRRIEVNGTAYGLEKRGQSSAACLGRHQRPGGSRVATYIYAASPRELLWVERWGDDVFVGAGWPVSASNVAFLPGS